jgi:hypothetical protein
VVDHYIKEPCDLHDLIEYAPDWNSLGEVRVILNPLRSTYPGITMEAAARLSSILAIVILVELAVNSAKGR